MFVLVVSRGHPSHRWPQYGIFEFDHAKVLRNSGKKVVFASVDLRSVRRWRKWGINFKEIDNIRIYDISIPFGKLPLPVLYFLGRMAMRILFKRIIRENGKPDLLHAHFTFIGAITSEIRNSYGIPLIVTEHNSLVHKDRLTKSMQLIGSIAYKNADRIISVSGSLAESIRNHFGYDSVVISNITDISHFSYREKEKRDSFRFLSVGNLIHQKGFDLLIDAFSKAGLGDEVYLDIIGTGNLRKSLQALINKSGLENRIRLLGEMKRSEIALRMHESDAFVLASRGETFGLAYIEAMASGLPVIATACGGPDEFVNDGNGILIPVESVESLKNALIEMRENINDYDRKSISENCISRFSEKTIESQLACLYNELLGK